MAWPPPSHSLFLTILLGWSTAIAAQPLVSPPTLLLSMFLLLCVSCLSSSSPPPWLFLIFLPSPSVAPRSPLLFLSRVTHSPSEHHQPSLLNVVVWLFSQLHLQVMPLMRTSTTYSLSPSYHDDLLVPEAAAPPMVASPLCSTESQS
jgi:hypothetical protein